MTRRIALFLILALVLAFGTAASQAADAAKGEIVAKGCKCHGTEFNGTDAQFVVDNLKAFRSGTRINKAMQNKASALTDEDIENVAAWFASQSK